MAIPTLVLAGEADDWLPASACQAMVKKQAGLGVPARLLVYPGAYHGFDIPAPSRTYFGHHLEYSASAAELARRKCDGSWQSSWGSDHPWSADF